MDFDTWYDLGKPENKFPLIEKSDFLKTVSLNPVLNLLKLSIHDLDADLFDQLKDSKNVVIIAYTQNQHAFADLRRLFIELVNNSIDLPVILSRTYSVKDLDEFMLFSSTDVGGLLTEGLGDGVMLNISDGRSKEDLQYQDLLKMCNETAFGILQATRTRITRTEYISCPSCGRTLFDLQETTAVIRNRTDHLKGVKIGIMGCIVNGPGEMADADYGYVGSGKGKITLYKGQEVVKRGVPSENAVDELINLIRSDGNWVEAGSTCLSADRSDH
jgi:(E)-4-hydroxy-3-methylbut-2-enyl-diphosphate synthase